jgi:CheY-like chemotaxis protein
MTLCPDDSAPLEFFPPPSRGAVASPPPAAKILIIEDDPDNFVLAHYVMEEAGYSVLGAGTGIAAIAQLQQHTVHLVLMDILLPDMDGFELLNTVRQGDRNATVPVIAITALALTPARRHLLETSFDGYLTKPYGIEALEAVVQAYCTHY